MKNMIGAPVREVGRPRPPAVAWCSQVYAAGGCTGVTPGRAFGEPHRAGLGFVRVRRPGRVLRSRGWCTRGATGPAAAWEATRRTSRAGEGSDVTAINGPGRPARR